jgi:hypothetical protein
VSRYHSLKVETRDAEAIYELCCYIPVIEPPLGLSSKSGLSKLRISALARRMAIAVLNQSLMAYRPFDGSPRNPVFIIRTVTTFKV